MSSEILIVDDNADIRNIINELILDAGYKTRLAANYNQALSEIDKKLPDVAILDVKLLIELDNSIEIDLSSNSEKIILNSDKEQMSRVFLNLIKNSIESIQQKAENHTNFNKKITIELSEKDDHINLDIVDNGIGFGKFSKNIKDILNPYFTTKKNGTGLGLSIVNKIINDHNGKIDFISRNDGAMIKINFIK